MAIKKLDPKAVNKVVSISDDAIDQEKSDLKAYGETLNVSKLVFKEGALPTFFLIKNISPMTQVEINEKHYNIGPPYVDESGVKHAAKVDVVHRTEMLLKYFKESISEVEENNQRISIKMEEYPFDILQEIGSYAMLHNTLGERLKKA